MCSLFRLSAGRHSKRRFRLPRQIDKVATDTNILDLRTRYRTRLGWFFWFCLIQRYVTTKGKWQILYLRTRYTTKLVGSFGSAQYSRRYFATLQIEEAKDGRWNAMTVIITVMPVCRPWCMARLPTDRVTKILAVEERGMPHVSRIGCEMP